MDNKNQNKLNSKDLEQDALELLDRAANGEIVSQEQTQTEDKSETADESIQSGDTHDEADIDTLKDKNDTADKKTDSEASDTEQKDPVKEENDDNKQEAALSACTDAEEPSSGSQSKNDKKNKSEKEQQEELRNLIAAAIENKKILKKANDTKDNKKTESQKGIEETSVDVSNEEDNEQPNEKKGFFSTRKKTKITVIVIVSLFIIIIGIIIGLFFHYTGLLNRKGDNTKNYSSMPVNESDLTSGSNTFDKAKREEELRAQLAKNAKKISDADVFNILLVGEDVRDPEESGRGNTDVMMIVSINKKNKTITLTSLLRDAWVYMEEYGTSNKLNAAFWHGGSEYLKSIVEEYYGIAIDRYVSVNFESFIDIVKAVGGLDFDVKENEAEAMKDPLDEVNDIMGKPHGTGYLKAGKQHLDGYQALAYSRIRYNCGNDYGRTQRQRAVISQIIQKSKKLSLVQLDELLKKVLPKVTTDVTDGEIASMLLSAFDYMTYDIQQLQIPAANYFTEDTIDSQSVLSPNFDANKAIIQKVIYGKLKNAEQAGKEYEQELANGTYNY